LPKCQLQRGADSGALPSLDADDADAQSSRAGVGRKPRPDLAGEEAPHIQL